jgi:hypothetical protein
VIVQQEHPSMPQKRPIARIRVATCSGMTRAVVLTILVAACGGSSTDPTGSGDSLLFNLVNQTQDTFKVELGFITIDTTIVLPGQTKCLSYGQSLYYPRGPDGEAYASVMIYPQYHLDRWLTQPTWGSKRYPQVTLTYSADNQFTWSIGASPCAPPPSVTPALSTVTARLHVTSATTASPDTCVVNTGYKVHPDTLLTYSALTNADYDGSTHYPRMLELESGFRDSTATIGLKAHIISQPPTTLDLSWYVHFPNADSSFVSWSRQFRLTCGGSFP